MKAKLRKLGANLLGGCLGELNPDPFADDFGKLELAGHGGLEQVQNLEVRSERERVNETVAGLKD